MSDWSSDVCSSVIAIRCVVLFVYKQKTAYEMRISDWSSDVCSSDLQGKTAFARQFLEQALALAQSIQGEGSGLAALPALPLSELLYERSEERRVGNECVCTCR